MITKTLAVYTLPSGHEVVREFPVADDSGLLKLISRPLEVKFQHRISADYLARIAEVEEKMAPLAQRLQELQQERARLFGDALAQAENIYRGAACAFNRLRYCVHGNVLGQLEHPCEQCEELRRAYTAR